MLFFLQNLQKRFKSRLVLDLPSLELQEKTIYALLGPNGSGKTTLLHILAFLLTPSSGSINFKGTPVPFNSTLKLNGLRRRVVLVQQHPILFTSSVFKNVEYGLRVRKIPKAKRLKIVRESLELVGMHDFESAAAHRLSGGETQRVAIARALACSPEVLLFDEPTASVDAEHQATISAIIKDIHAHKQISIIFSTHNHLQAADLAQQKIYLFQGKMGFSLAENVLTGITEQSGQNQVFCRVNSQLQIPVNLPAGKRIKLGIHPSKLGLLPAASIADIKEPSYPGRLTQLSEQEDYVRAVVNIGTPLHLMLTLEEYRKRPFTIGQSIAVEIPPSAIKILEEN